MTADGYGISFWGDQNTLELDRVMVVQLVNMLLKKNPLNYIKERFMVCELCLICLKEEELYEDILVKVNSPGRITRELPTVKGSGMGRGQGWEGP